MTTKRTLRKNRFAWYLVTAVALLYLLSLHEVPLFNFSEGWDMVLLSLQRILYLGSVALAAWYFGGRTGIAVTLVGIPALAWDAYLHLTQQNSLFYLLELLLIVGAAWVICRLIINNQQSGSRLRQSEQQYRDLLENLPYMVLIFDAEKIKYANQAAVELLGASSRSDFYHRRVSDFIPPAEWPRIESRIHEVLQAGTIVPVLEEKLLRFDGAEIEVEIAGHSVYYSGAPAVQLIGHDINQRKQAEARVIESEERYRVTAEQTGKLIYDYDVLSGKIYWQGAVEIITGYTPEEFAAVDIKAWEDMVHPDDRESTLRALEQSRRDCAVFDMEYRFRRKDGSYIHIGETGRFLSDADGRAYRMLGSMGDISSRKHAESALNSIIKSTARDTGEAFFHSLVKNLAQGLDVSYAFVGRLTGDQPDQVRTLSFWSGDEFGENFTYNLESTPCRLVSRDRVCLYTEHVQHDFPDDLMLQQMNIQSYMGVPLRNQSEEVIGIIVVMDSAPLREPKLAESMLRVFADRAGTELERLQSARELEQSHRLIKAVSQAQNRYITEADPSALFQSLIDEVIKITGSRLGVITEAVSEKESAPYLKVRAVAHDKAGFSSQVAAKARDMEFRDPDTILGAVLDTGRPVLSNNPAELPWRRPVFPGHPEITSFLGLPVAIRGRIIGVIAVANRPEGYSQKDIDYLEPLILTTGNILEAHNNTEKRQQAEQALQRNYELQHVISSLLGRSLRPGTLTEILDDALGLILSLPWLAADNRGAIFLTEGDPPYLKLVARHGQTDEIKEFCQKVPFGQCLCGRAAQEQSVVFAGNDTRIENVREKALPHGHYCVPIRHGEKVLGVFTIYLEPEHRRDPEEDRFLKSVADTLANIIHAHYLLEEEFFHANILVNVRDSVIVTDNQGLITYWNQGAEAIFGYTAREMMGKSPTELYPDQDMSQFQADLDAIVKGRDYVGEWLGRRKDGRRVWVNIKTSVLRDADGEFTGFIGVAQDITQRKNTEQELEASRESLLDAQRIAHIGNWEWDIPGGSLYWSDEIYRIFGLKPQQFKPGYKKFISFVHPEDRREVNQAVNDALEKRKPYNIEHRVMLPDKSIRYVAEQAEVVFDQSGQALKMSGTVQDITKRKLAEKRQQSIYRLTSSLNKARDLDEIFQTAIDIVIDTLEAEKASLLTFDSTGTMRFKAWRGLSEKYRAVTEGHSPWTQSDNNPEPYLVYDIAREPSLADLEPAITAEDIKSLGFFPLTLSDDGKLLGKFMVYYGKPHRFTEDEIQLAQTIAAHISFAIQRKQTETAVKNLQRHQQMILDSAGEGIFGVDLEGLSTFINPVASTLTGYEPQEFIGQNQHELIHHSYPDGSPYPEEECLIYNSYAADSVNYVSNEVFWHKNGTSFPVEYTSTPTHDEQGKVTGAVVVFKDITRRRQEEAKLQESEKKFRTYTDKSPVGIFVVDENGNYVEVNPAACDISGYSRMELLNLSIADFTAPEHLDEGLRIFEELKEKGHFEGEFLARKKDDRRFWIYMNAVKIGPNRYMAFVTDITERKQTEHELQRLASFPLFSPIPIIEVSLEGELTYLNPSTRQVFPEITRNTHDHPLVRAMLATLSYLPGLPDQWVMFDVVIGNNVYEVYVLYDTASRHIRGYIVDITLHKQSLQLESEARAAEMSSKAKSDMLASMSHELRTPLNAIIGFSQVLQEEYFGKLNAQQSEYMNDILTSGQHLLSLINDILDLSKVESGKVELELKPTPLKEMLEHSMMVIREKARVHNIDLRLEVAPELESLELELDERRVRQVIFNLLSNAAKFTPDGGAITLGAASAGKQDIVISVADTGIGIEPEHQEKIFEGFYQVKNQITDKTPGTGLGLSLARSIVELHGGRVWVESEGRNRGSKFSFTLPLKQKKHRRKNEKDHPGR